MTEGCVWLYCLSLRHDLAKLKIAECPIVTANPVNMLATVSMRTDVEADQAIVGYCMECQLCIPTKDTHISVSTGERHSGVCAQKFDRPSMDCAPSAEGNR